MGDETANQSVSWFNEVDDHDDANMISLGEWMISEEFAITITDVWLATAVEGGRHVPRLAKIDSGTAD